jgi:hypothetical protein
VTDQNHIVDRVVETLKEPVQLDPNLVSRVMAEIENGPALHRDVSPIRAVLEWFWRRRTIRLSPLGGLAMAAGVAAMVLLGGRILAPGTPSEQSLPGIAQAGETVIQFVLVAPEAASVALVGDFNDWNVSATPLVQDQGDGVWSVTVPLTPGRYQYSFLVDGSTWIQDPRAARAVEDEFGRPNSVVTIGGA